MKISESLTGLGFGLCVRFTKRLKTTWESLPLPEYSDQNGPSFYAVAGILELVHLDFE